MVAAIWLMTLLEFYAAAGVLFAAAFVTVGISQVDPVAKGSRAGFRLIVLPGVAALWPFLILRWVRARRSQP